MIGGLAHERSDVDWMADTPPPPLSPPPSPPPLSPPSPLLLGMEHRLHRKKVLGSIARLKYAEAERERQYMLKQLSKEQLIAPLAAAAAEMGGGSSSSSIPLPVMPLTTTMANPATTIMVPPPAAAAPANISFNPVGTQEITNGPRLDLAELMSWVRHSKNGKLKVRFLGKDRRVRGNGGEGCEYQCW